MYCNCDVCKCDSCVSSCSTCDYCGDYLVFSPDGCASCCYSPRPVCCDSTSSMKRVINSCKQLLCKINMSLRDYPKNKCVCRSPCQIVRNCCNSAKLYELRDASTSITGLTCFCSRFCEPCVVSPRNLCFTSCVNDNYPCGTSVDLCRQTCCAEADCDPCSPCCLPSRNPCPNITTMDICRSYKKVLTLPGGTCTEELCPLYHEPNDAEYHVCIDGKPVKMVSPCCPDGQDVCVIEKCYNCARPKRMKKLVMCNCECTEGPCDNKSKEGNCGMSGASNNYISTHKVSSPFPPGEIILSRKSLSFDKPNVRNSPLGIIPEVSHELVNDENHGFFHDDVSIRPKHSINHSTEELRGSHNSSAKAGKNHHRIKSDSFSGFNPNGPESTRIDGHYNGREHSHHQTKQGSGSTGFSARITRELTHDATHNASHNSKPHNLLNGESRRQASSKSTTNHESRTNGGHHMVTNSRTYTLGGNKVDSASHEETRPHHERSSSGHHAASHSKTYNSGSNRTDSAGHETQRGVPHSKTHSLGSNKVDFRHGESNRSNNS